MQDRKIEASKRKKVARFRSASDAISREARNVDVLGGEKVNKVVSIVLFVITIRRDNDARRRRIRIFPSSIVKHGS